MAGNAFFPFWALGLFLLLSCLYHGFRFFVSWKAAIIFSFLPAMLLIFFLKDLPSFPTLLSAMVLGAVLRLVVITIRNVNKNLLYCAVPLDIIALYLFFFRDRLTGVSITEKALGVCLTILTMSALQTLVFEKNKVPFPIYYFLIIGILTCVIPMKEKPIDWTPVVVMGQKLADAVKSASSDISYLFTSAFGGSYTSGYSSLMSEGARLDVTERTQLILKTNELPYHTFSDDTGNIIKLRKTIYLAGSNDVDRTQFLRFVNFLYENGVDRETASVFTEVSKIEIEYAYLDTGDIIAPSNAVIVTGLDGKSPEEGRTTIHRKGYRLNARYLEIDYASPKLIQMFRMAGKETDGNDTYNINTLTYEAAEDYVKELWDMDLWDIMSPEEYVRISEETKIDAANEYLDVSGTSKELRALAQDITEGAMSDYDRCRRVESYLRQYPYSTNAEGGYDSGSDMSTIEGMADIAQRFLFDTGKGYCVHYTSSMVILLRLCGIPARAAAGFRYAFPFEMMDEYKVSSGCAHVWPEAYIENAGWIPFEPTGAYYTRTNTNWHRGRYIEDDERVPVYEEIDLPEVSAIASPDPEEEETTPAFLALKVILPTFGLAVFIAIILLVGTYLIRVLGYKYGTPCQKLYYDVDHIKKALIKKSENRLKDRGLLSDFIKAAPKEMQEDLATVYNAFYRMEYKTGKDTDPTPEETALAMELRKKLEKNLNQAKLKRLNRYHMIK